MNNTFSGTIFKIDDTKNITETFVKREFIVVSDGKYPQYVKFQLTQDRCDIMDRFKTNDFVTVHFNLEGKVVEKGKYAGSVFNNITAWKVEAQGAASSPQPQATTSKQYEDDLPF